MEPVLDPCQLRRADHRERLKYSLGFLICRVVYLVTYIIAIYALGWRHWPLYWVLLGIVFHASTILPAWRCDGCGQTLFFLAQATALIIDGGLIALTRYDVQGAFDVHSVQDVWCLLEKSCHYERLLVSRVTTQVFAFILFYYMIFVLDEMYPSVIGALCVLLYSSVTLAAHFVYHDFALLVAHQDLVCLVFAFLISVTAKRKMSQSKHMLMDFLERQKEHVVREKVLRCEAEFTCEQLVSQQATMEVSLQVPQSYSDGSAAAASEVACSAQTAPPLLQHAFESRKCVLPCLETSDTAEDCLPASAVVWVENYPAPKPLNSVTPGDRALCYDNVGRGLTYATVKQCHPIIHSTKCDWIAITLADGTQLQTTADHPVVVESCPNNALKSQQGMLELRRQCVRADEIDAEQHCLMVFRMIATPVAQIEKMMAGGTDEVSTSEEQWITITVDQPDRYELLVAERNKAGVAGHPIAVGSSDRLPSSMSQEPGYGVKNTFIDTTLEEGRVLKRSNSEPSNFKFHGCAMKLSPASDMQSSSLDTSASTEPSADAIVDQVITGPKLIRLTDFVHAKSAGTSLGSLHEEDVHCRPCSFHISWLHSSKRFCKFSTMCEYCHDSSHHWGRHAKYRSRFRKHRKPY